MEHDKKQREVTVVDKHGKEHHGVAVLLESDDVLREKFGNFSKFLQEYAVIGLALGFIVGAPANEVVKQFVGTFLNPLVAILFGQDLSSRTATFHHGHSPVLVPWGGFVYALINFLFVLISIYAAVKLLKLDRYIKKPEDDKKK